MSSERRADLIIVGSGQAGVPLATRSASAGKQVIVIERGNPGGTCVNVGCTPTKTLVAAARAAHVARTAARFGVHVSDVSIDFGEVMARKDAIVQRWRAGVDRRLASAPDKLHLVRGQARFVGPKLLEVEGRRYGADTIVINVGAKPSLPYVEGLQDVPHLDSTGLLDVKQLPEHLLILGAGYIASERDGARHRRRRIRAPDVR
jgi:pyruvate/2-oxoglutarate dehydrogenase complex dihydrolipoamide dehydrogenase (E3) component